MDPTTFLDGRVTLHCGDCLDVLARMPENSVDSVVTDPPYHLTSIVKRFGPDGSVPPVSSVQRRFAKNGAALSIGPDGEPTPDQYGRLSKGFMGKQWDGGDIAFQPSTWAAVLRVLKPGGYLLAFASTRGIWRMGVAIEDGGFIPHPMIAWVFGSGFPKATRIKAEGYDGFRYGGQALKPAIEPIFMGQKPFSEANGTANILLHGTGALNIDGCRVGTDGARNNGRKVDSDIYGKMGPIARVDYGMGRWPANLLHDGSDEVLAGFPTSESTIGKPRGAASGAGWGMTQTGAEYDAAGSAARFFYSSKADAEDRIGSKHPTVKPLDLMQYLCRLVTPPGGTVLDLFAGTGTTGEAAWREGFKAILIEREAEYQADIARRMDLAVKPAKRAAVAKTKNNLMGAEGTPLFGGEAA